MSIKRYEVPHSTRLEWLQEDDDGRIVLHDDHVAEVERLKSALKHWQDAFDRVQTKANNQEDKVLSMSADVHALEAEVERLRARVPNPNDLRMVLDELEAYAGDGVALSDLGKVVARVRATLEEA